MKTWERTCDNCERNCSHDTDDITPCESWAGWILADAEIPGHEDFVLIVTQSQNGSQNIDKGYYMSGRWAHRGTAKVTHWRPMPVLPQPETM